MKLLTIHGIPVLCYKHSQCYKNAIKILTKYLPTINNPSTITSEAIVSLTALANAALYGTATAT